MRSASLTIDGECSQHVVSVAHLIVELDSPRGRKGVRVSHNRSPSNPCDASRTGSMSRREFGRIIGASAAAGSIDALSMGEAGAQTSASASRAAKGDELCEMTAVDLAARIRRKDVSAREV